MTRNSESEVSEKSDTSVKRMRASVSFHEGDLSDGVLTFHKIEVDAERKVSSFGCL
jgi:hypothetical protein